MTHTTQHTFGVELTFHRSDMTHAMQYTFGMSNKLQLHSIVFTTATRYTYCPHVTVILFYLKSDILKLGGIKITPPSVAFPLSAAETPAAYRVTCPAGARGHSVLYSVQTGAMAHPAS
jgi:hypothetical protein